MKSLVWLVVLWLCAGCASRNANVGRSRTASCPRAQVVAAARKLAAGIESGISTPATNSWRRLTCREELIGKWRGKNVADFYVFDYDDVQGDFRQSKKISVKTMASWDLFSDGRCNGNWTSEGVGSENVRFRSRNGTWTYSDGVLSIHWNEAKSDVRCRVWQLDSGDLVMQNLFPLSESKSSVYHAEESFDEYGCKRHIASDSGLRWGIDVLAPPVFSCWDKLDREKFALAIRSSQRERGLKSLLDAGVVTEEEFLSEKQKLGGSE